MYVFFVIDLASRKVEVAGISRQPDGPWMDQMARNLLDAVAGSLRGKRFLIVDRDRLYTMEFREALERAGTTVLGLPPRSPNLNAFAERFVLWIRTECLNRIVPLGERYLRRAISDYMAHYHEERITRGWETCFSSRRPPRITAARCAAISASAGCSAITTEKLPERPRRSSGTRRQDADTTLLA